MNGMSLTVQWLRLPYNAGDVGSILGWGAEIPHASWPKKKNPKHKTEAIL